MSLAESDFYYVNAVRYCLQFCDFAVESINRLAVLCHVTYISQVPLGSQPVALVIFYLVELQPLNFVSGHVSTMIVE